MRDAIFKLRLLAKLLRGEFEVWRDEIWRRNLDAPYCCDGRECGCGAATLRDIYVAEVRRAP